jgi:hypothetical protein
MRVFDSRKEPVQFHAISSAHMYGPRAAAGIGSACGPGASPTPDLRGCFARLQKRKRLRAGASCETQQQLVRPGSGMGPPPVSPGTTKMCNANGTIGTNPLIGSIPVSVGQWPIGSIPALHANCAVCELQTLFVHTVCMQALLPSWIEWKGRGS